MNVISILDEDKFIFCVNIVGTHDSATAYVDMENTARCQDKTIAEQLKLGVRLLDIRLGKKGESFYLVHALANCYCDEDKKRQMTFDEVFSLCKDFLKENPKEFIILSIKQDRGIMSKGFFPQFYNRYIKDNESFWYLKNDLPTVGECRGKMVLMRRCKVRRKFTLENQWGLDFSFWKDQAKNKMTALPVKLNSDTTALVQDRYSLKKEDKWQCSKAYLDIAHTDKSSLNVHFISTSAKTDGSLLGTAEYINKNFMAYELKKGSGWILCDFVTKEIAEKIMMSNLEKSEKI